MNLNFQSRSPDSNRRHGMSLTLHFQLLTLNFKLTYIPLQKSFDNRRHFVFVFNIRHMTFT